MKKNSLLKKDNSIIRVLEVQNERVFIIDCIKRTMPKWVEQSEISDYVDCTEAELLESMGASFSDIDSLDAESKRFVREHFTLISGVLPFVSDECLKNKAIQRISDERNVSKQTIRNYLCLYLVYQDVAALAPKQKPQERELSQDEKNFRWALNKFFYTRNKNSLTTTYTMMLKEKYCDACGVLLPEYPSIHRFRYYFKKHKNMQTYYISRDGLKSYQRNNRPLTGDGVQEFAPNIGVGMLDATICDVYLVNDSGNLVGRPILTACIDAYSGLCCGYALTWEGGVYSLRGLMLNVIADKVEHCRKHGIGITKSIWDCDKLPATLVTDMGSEYISDNFEQIAELGVTLINLPAYRPELKSKVEKFFDLIQDSFKPYLKGKGLIEPDYQERGVHDYRRDACLTMEQFEGVLLYCILYYNSKRIVDNFPFTADMLQAKVQPFASSLWEWGKTQIGANLISVTAEEMILTLLPRTQGKFSRYGLKVNGLRYKHENYAEKFLSGGTVTVAYNPDDVSYVWLIENGVYICFTLIESRFKGEELQGVQMMQQEQKSLVKAVKEVNIQAQIQLASHIETIVKSTATFENTNIKGIRDKL